jgi:alpha-2-macroglobulin
VLYNWIHRPGVGWTAEQYKRDVLVTETDLKGGATASNLEVPIDWGQYRLELTDPATNLSLRYRFYGGYGYGSSYAVDAAPEKVRLSLDQARYKAGSVVKLNAISPHPGQAVLLVETDRLLVTQQFDIDTTAKTIEFTLPNDVDRHDIYASVLVVRPGESAERRTPKRALGVVHIPLDRSERVLTAEVKLPKMSKPGAGFCGQRRGGDLERSRRRHRQHHWLHRTQSRRQLLPKAPLYGRSARCVWPRDRKPGR